VTAPTVFGAAPVQPHKGVFVMTATSHPTAGGPTHRAQHEAWWSLLLFPVSFVLAFLVGEGIPPVFGYPEPSLDSTPWWVITLAVVPALLVFAAPFVVTAHFSNKAVTEGEQRGRLPLILAGAAVGLFVVLNLAGGLAQFLSHS
jgi:hypothetical protein